MNGIARARDKAGLTQWAVAVALDIRETTYRNWERGRTAPSGPHLLRLARLFRCRPEELLDLDDQVETP